MAPRSGSVTAFYGQGQAPSNVAREAGAGLAQTGGGAYTVGGIASNVNALKDGDRSANGGHWSATSGSTLDITLAASRTISEVVLIGNPGTTSNPTPNEASTWSGSNVFDTSTYTVQTWTGSAWSTVATVSGNLNHIRRVSFAPVATTKVRIIPVDDASNNLTASDNLASLTEVEIWTHADNLATQRFDAWGNLTQATGSIPTYGYTGREPDASGLIFYRARYYHPGLGRFASRDPLGMPGGINPYAYAGGNPVGFNDPSGLLAKQTWNAAVDYAGQASQAASDSFATSPAANIGKAIGGVAAYGTGIVTGNSNLADAALQGLGDTRQQNVDTLLLLGTAGRSGGAVGSGPVILRAPPGATAAEMAQLKGYCAGCNAALGSGSLSPTGRVSTGGSLRIEANTAAAAERARAAAAGQPYQGVAGHVPDTTWTGNAQPSQWLDLSPRLNSSLGGQTNGYPVGYKPTEFLIGK